MTLAQLTRCAVRIVEANAPNTRSYSSSETTNDKGEVHTNTVFFKSISFDEAATVLLQQEVGV